jgi:hypothetical protein
MDSSEGSAAGSANVSQQSAANNMLAPSVAAPLADAGAGNALAQRDVTTVDGIASQGYPSDPTGGLALTVLNKPSPLPPPVDFTDPVPVPAPSFPPPSIGRIVHYRAANRGERPGGRDRHAAIITAVNDDGSVELSVFPPGFNPMFISAAQGSPSEEFAHPGQWYWPPRV